MDFSTADVCCVVTTAQTTTVVAHSNQLVKQVVISPVVVTVQEKPSTTKTRGDVHCEASVGGWVGGEQTEPSTLGENEEKTPSRHDLLFHIDIERKVDVFRELLACRARGPP